MGDSFPPWNPRVPHDYPQAEEKRQNNYRRGLTDSGKWVYLHLVQAVP